MREKIRQQIQVGKNPETDTDFGFILPEGRVLETGQIFVLSNFQVMPNAGGWDDQDADWTQDMMTFLTIRAQEYARDADPPPDDQLAHRDWTHFA